MRRNSVFGARYAFGFNRTISSSVQQPPGSHNASLNFSTTLSRRWSATISDYFSDTDALGNVNAFSGQVPQASNPSFAFSSATTQTSIRTNGANAGLSFDLDPSSSISFAAGHYIQKYSSGTSFFGLSLDQQQFFGSLTFQQQLGTTESWNLSYKNTYSEYGNSQHSISQSAQAGYSTQIGPGTTLQFGAGISQVNSLGRGRLSYDASARLGKTVQSNMFSLGFTQSSTERVGLGSTTTTRRADLNWNRAFGKVVASAGAFAYDSKGILSNALNTKGATGTGNVTVPINTRLSISGGVSYEKTKGAGTFSFTQQRTFASGNIAFALTRTLSISGGATDQDIQQTATPTFSRRSLFLSLRYSEPSLLRVR